MRRRAALAATFCLGLALAGCSAAGSGATSGTGGEPSTTTTPEASSAPAQALPTEEDLQQRLLTINELPLDGYVAVPNDGGSGVTPDTSDADVCQMNFGAILEGSDNVTMVTAGATFERKIMQEQLTTVLAAAPDASDFVREVEETLSACPSSSSTDDSAVAIEPLLTADVEIAAEEASCRTIQMTVSGGTGNASFCFVAVGDAVLMTLAMTRDPGWSYMAADDFATMTNAAIEKATA